MSSKRATARFCGSVGQFCLRGDGSCRKQPLIRKYPGRSALKRKRPVVRGEKLSGFNVPLYLRRSAPRISSEIATGGESGSGISLECWKDGDSFKIPCSREMTAKHFGMGGIVLQDQMHISARLYLEVIQTTRSRMLVIQVTSTSQYRNLVLWRYLHFLACCKSRNISDQFCPRIIKAIV